MKSLRRKPKEFDAKTTWQDYHSKYPVKIYLPDVSDRKKTSEWKEKYSNRNTLFQLRLNESKEFKALEEKKYTDADQYQIRKIQKHWKKRRAQEDLLVPVNLNGFHRSDFVEMVHGQFVKKSIHKEKLNILNQAIENGDYKAEIFSDPHLLHLALGLFAAAKISQQQMTTIIESKYFYEDYKDDKSKKTFPILDAEGRFTTHAQNFLLNPIHLEKEDLEEFRLLVRALPKSEQIFHIRSGENYKKEKKKIDELAKKTASQSKSLEYQLVKSNIILYNIYQDNSYFCHLSVGARHALVISRFGVKNAIRDVGTFGSKSIQEIDQGVHEKKRFGALSFPGTIPFKDIHDFKRSEITDTIATAHDDYHANIMSGMGENIQNALLRLVKVVRTTVQPDLKSPWSKEIWDWIDGELLYLLNHHSKFHYYKKNKTNQLSTSSTTELFCHTLLFKKENLNYNQHLINNGHITAVGIIFLLDVLKNPAEWKKFKIDFEELFIDHSLGQFYLELSKIESALKKDSIKIQLLKTMLYLNLKNSEKHQLSFNKISTLISDNAQHIESQLKFKKVKKESKSGSQKNSIYLSYADIAIDHDPKKNDWLILELTKLKNNSPHQSEGSFKNSVKSLLRSIGLHKTRAPDKSITENTTVIKKMPS